MGFVATVREEAANTPARRNRVVDLWRAVSILVVVLGHWTMAAVTVRDGGLVPGHLLVLAGWTHPLTWAFQVMPVFFLVGGYANGRSWRSARERATPYGAWLRGRARRLTLPVVPVLLFWPAAGWLALQAGVDWRTLRLATSVALVPTWFLAAYVLVVALAPATVWLWERWGWWSVVAGGLAAGTVDVVSLGSGSVAVGFVNYLLVWGTLHQLGYAWLDGRLASVARRLLLAGTGLAAAVLLVQAGPYPVSMVGLDTSAVDNTYPTRVTLLFLGMAQAGLLLLLDPLAGRLVQGRRAWTLVVAVNARIMTVYLWHVTAMVLVIAASLVVGGVGLRARPLGASWWWSRPLWFLVLAVVTTAFVAGLGRLETVGPDPRPAPPAWRPLLAVAGVCAGLAALAVVGAVDSDGLSWVLFLVPVLAVVAGGLVRRPGLTHDARRAGITRPRR
ncbi:acyltransferase [Nocardioides sp. WL0053]|uniref:Acyltransferase n=1 Tax=Nocardioides jiangsuensis TaxID=2866161 RepID=A0ABS7RML6_9ACTN|nr:acyltransferase [Nocardioides jiangsuensis]MBY9076304.1 acyltransferase [Nocardioides jiangsuensis]